MERVGALLRSLGGNDPLRRRLAEARALEAWPELVGPHLAKLTRPLRIAGGRLFVLAHGSALRQELVFRRGEILRRVNAAAGGGRVARQLVLLESDANLSSLVEAAEAAETAAPRPTGERRASDRPPADDPAATDERDESDEEVDEDVDEIATPWVPVVPPFDAAAYRNDMDRIARESAGLRPARPGTGARRPPAGP